MYLIRPYVDVKHSKNILIFCMAYRQRIYSRLPGGSPCIKMVITRHPFKFSAKSAIYTAAGCQHIIAIYTAAVPEQIQNIYMAAVCPHKIAIYTAAIQEPNRLYTLLPVVYKNRYLHGSHSRAKSAIYIAAGCIQKEVTYTAAVQEPNRLYTLLTGVYIDCYLHESHSRGPGTNYCQHIP